MAINLNASSVKSASELTLGGLPLPGRYHVMVTDCTEGDSSVEAKFQILAGTTPGQEGKQLTEWFHISDKAIKRLVRFAMCAGLIAPGEEKDVDFVGAVGAQLVIEVEEQEYQGKKKTRISADGLWPVDDAAVASVPKSADAGELAAASTAAAADDEFGDL